MPAPTTHKLRTKVVYEGDDGQPYIKAVPAVWIQSGVPLNLVAAQQADLDAFPDFPANWRPRHVRAETTDGTDADGAYHVFSRNFICNPADTSPGGNLAPGATFDYEGCHWKVRGRIGEKHYDR